MKRIDCSDGSFSMSTSISSFDQNSFQSKSKINLPIEDIILFYLLFKDKITEFHAYRTPIKLGDVIEYHHEIHLDKTIYNYYLNEDSNIYFICSQLNVDTRELNLHQMPKCSFNNNSKILILLMNFLSKFN